MMRRYFSIVLVVLTTSFCWSLADYAAEEASNNVQITAAETHGACCSSQAVAAPAVGSHDCCAQQAGTDAQSCCGSAMCHCKSCFHHSGSGSVCECGCEDQRSFPEPLLPSSGIRLDSAKTQVANRLISLSDDLLNHGSRGLCLDQHALATGAAPQLYLRNLSIRI